MNRKWGRRTYGDQSCQQGEKNEASWHGLGSNGMAV